MNQTDDQTEDDASVEALRIAEQKIQLEADKRLRQSMTDAGRSTDPDRNSDADPTKAPEPAV